MMTLGNYVPIAKALLEQIADDPRCLDDPNLLTQALYSAYCDGVNVSNAQRELEATVAKRRGQQRAENDEYLQRFLEQQQKPSEGN